MVYTYRRVSTPTNKKKAGNRRHQEATRREAERRLLNIGKSIEDIVSGSLPADQRETFIELMEEAQENDVSEVLVETARDVARDSFESEVLYRKSRDLGVQITPADMPDLFVHDPTPVQTFFRKVMTAYFQLEKDMAVHRMIHGLHEKKVDVEKALKEAKKVGSDQAVVRGKRVPVRNLLTQKKTPKGNGRKSILQMAAPTPVQEKNAIAACRCRHRGDYGWRTLAHKLTKILRVPSMTHESARRTSDALLLRKAQKTSRTTAKAKKTSGTTVTAAKAKKTSGTSAKTKKTWKIWGTTAKTKKTSAKAKKISGAAAKTKKTRRPGDPGHGEHVRSRRTT